MSIKLRHSKVRFPIPKGINLPGEKKQNKILNELHRKEKLFTAGILLLIMILSIVLMLLFFNLIIKM